MHIRLREAVATGVTLLVICGCSATGSISSSPPVRTSPSRSREPAISQKTPAGTDLKAPTGGKTPASGGTPGLAEPSDSPQTRQPAPMVGKSAAPLPTLRSNGGEGDYLVEDEEEENEAAGLQDPEESLNRALALCRHAKAFWKRGDLERAIENLDEAYALILEVEAENDPKLLQEKEDLRVTISKRILEIYSSRHVAVNGTRNEIPITINQHVQEEIDSFTIGRERDFFLESYQRSGKFRLKIETALREAGLPPELSWLPLIESGFKVTALSPARALGLWQFIPSTGYRYGLNRDTFIDERLDPDKSTRAAIEYLRELHGMFGDWTTVLAAYNCGEHRVLRTIHSQNINYLDNFWDLYERLPRETARYVPRFLATLHIIQSPERYRLINGQVYEPLAYETVAVPRQVHLKAVAQTSGIEEAALRELNAELRQGLLPTDGYDLRVPPGMTDIVLTKLDEIPTYRPNARVSVIRHRMRRGETLDSVARKYGSDPKTILLANNLRRPSPLAAGKVIRVPLDTCQPEVPLPSRAPKSGAPETVEHVVQRGDSIWNIARRYGTTTDKIQQLNKVDSANLSVGQTLKVIPTVPAAYSEPPKSRRQVYSVRKGDTLGDISRQHHMSLERLLTLNKLTVRSKLQPGQKILVE